MSSKPGRTTCTSTAVYRQTFLNLVTAGDAWTASALLLLIAMIVYPVAYALFAVFYSLYGTILFVTGPLVLALMPSFGLGSLARRYAINVMIFGAWGLIYGIFCRLAIAINVNSMAALTSANSFAGVLAGASQEILLAVASILFSVCILLIPVLAKRIVEGDLGGSMLTVLGAATTMAQSLMSIAAGASGGMQGAAAGGGGGAAQAPGAELPPPLQTLLRPVRRRLAVEREAAPHLRFSFAARPIR